MPSNTKPVIPLKRRDETMLFKLDICAAHGCDQPPGAVYTAGVAFHKEKGDVPLCAAHLRQRIKLEPKPKGDPLKTAELLSEQELEDFTNEQELVETPKAPKKKGPGGRRPEEVVEDPAKLPEPSPQILEAAAGLQALLKTQLGNLQQEAMEAQEALQLVNDFVVRDQSDADFAQECLIQSKSEWQRLDDMEKRATRPMLESIEEVRSWYRPAKTFYRSCEELWKAKLKDAQQLFDTLQLQALRVAEKAAKAGDAAKVNLALIEASEAPLHLNKGVSIVDKWTWELIDIEKVPRTFLTLDEKAVTQAVRHLKDKTNIPGIRVYNEKSVRAGVKK